MIEARLKPTRAENLEAAAFWSASARRVMDWYPGPSRSRQAALLALPRVELALQHLWAAIA